MAEQKPVVRPLFSSTELGIKEKLLVAVIANSSLFREFGAPINKTLSGYVNKLLFFVDGKPLPTDITLPFVSFPAKNVKPYQFVSC